MLQAADWQNNFTKLVCDNDDVEEQLDSIFEVDHTPSLIWAVTLKSHLILKKNNKDNTFNQKSQHQIDFYASSTVQCKTLNCAMVSRQKNFNVLFYDYQKLATGALQSEKQSLVLRLEGLIYHL
jgi:hypothetical protein